MLILVGCTGGGRKGGQFSRGVWERCESYWTGDKRMAICLQKTEVQLYGRIARSKLQDWAFSRTRWKEDNAEVHGKGYKKA